MAWGMCAPRLLRHRVPLVDKAVLSTSGITRSGRSAKSGRPSTSGVELRPVLAGYPRYMVGTGRLRHVYLEDVLGCFGIKKMPFYQLS